MLMDHGSLKYGTPSRTNLRNYGSYRCLSPCYLLAANLLSWEMRIAVLGVLNLYIQLLSASAAIIQTLCGSLLTDSTLPTFHFATHLISEAIS
jgi:hypothetical protein